MSKFIAALFAATLALTAAHAADAPTFAVGQRWTIKDSPTIQIVIGRIEPFGTNKTAVSISVFGVPCPPQTGCTTTTLAHTPFDGDTLAASVDKLIATDAQPATDFEEGYAEWKNAKGGGYTIPVSQLPELIFKALPSGAHLSN